MQVFEATEIWSSVEYGNGELKKMKFVSLEDHLLSLTDKKEPTLAAAPELLHALQLMTELSSRNTYKGYRNAVNEIARAAIAKAKGASK